MAAQHFNQESDLIAALKSYTQADADGVMVKVSRQACDEAVDRIAALERDLAEANSLAHSLAMTIERLEAEAAALRADAERYRWLRNAAMSDDDEMMEQLAKIDPQPATPKDFDAAIDRARGAAHE